MAPLMGSRSWQWFTPTYGDYVRAGRGQQRAHEKREFARELLPGGLLPSPLDDTTECVHGCHGECLDSQWGDGRCSFSCHPDGPVTEEEYWAARAVNSAAVSS